MDGWMDGWIGFFDFFISSHSNHMLYTRDEDTIKVSRVSAD